MWLKTQTNQRFNPVFSLYVLIKARIISCSSDDSKLSRKNMILYSDWVRESIWEVTCETDRYLIAETTLTSWRVQFRKGTLCVITQKRLFSRCTWILKESENACRENVVKVIRRQKPKKCGCSFISRNIKRSVYCQYG